MKKNQRPIKFSVTGHRYLHGLPGIKTAIREVLEKIAIRYHGLPLLHFNPLAPGADQLTAQLAVDASIPLIVLLPFSQDEYLSHFREEALSPFFELCEQAKEIITLPDKEDPDSAYQELGEYLVEQMDVLIGIWNGQPPRGPGGTGDVVERFRQSDKPLAWIRADNALPGEPIPLTGELQQGSVSYENW